MEPSEHHPKASIRAFREGTLIIDRLGVSAETLYQYIWRRCRSYWCSILTEDRTMRMPLLFGASFVLAAVPALAQNLTEISQFAQNICSDIPSGSLTRSNIQGKVQANAGLFAKIVSGSAEFDAAKSDEIYKGIPFEKLPPSIPTVTMCKLELAKVLLEKK